MLLVVVGELCEQKLFGAIIGLSGSKAIKELIQADGTAGGWLILQSSGKHTDYFNDIPERHLHNNGI